MRKPKTQIVRRGALYATGATKPEARAELEKQIDRACDLPGPIVETRFGLVLITVADGSGWQSTIIDPASGDRPCYCCFGPVAPVDAIQSIRVNAAQRAWNPRVDDSAHIAAAGLDDRRAGELRDWIQFQRDYVAGRSMLVDVVAADTGILEHISVSLAATIGDDSHDMVRAVAEIRAHGRALIGGGAAPAFYLTAA